MAARARPASSLVPMWPTMAVSASTYSALLTLAPITIIASSSAMGGSLLPVTLTLTVASSVSPLPSSMV